MANKSQSKAKQPVIDDDQYEDHGTSVFCPSKPQQRDSVCSNTSTESFEGCSFGQEADLPL